MKGKRLHINPPFCTLVTPTTNVTATTTQLKSLGGKNLSGNNLHSEVTQTQELQNEREEASY